MNNVQFDKTIATSDLVEMVSDQLETGAVAYKEYIAMANRGDDTQDDCDLQAAFNPEVGYDKEGALNAMGFAVRVSSQHLPELAIRATESKEAADLLAKLPSYYAVFTGRKGVVDVLNKPNFDKELATIFGGEEQVVKCNSAKLSTNGVLASLADAIAKLASK